MRKPKIFTATFEESLNFEDDPLLKWHNQDVEQPNHRERPVLLFIIACICILMLYGVHRITGSLTIERPDSPVPKADINFSQEWGIIITCCVFGVFIFLLFKGQIDSIQRTLFSSQEIRTIRNASKSRIINIASILGGIAYICYIILKIVFPHIGDARTRIAGLIGIVAMWFIADLVIIAMEIYIEFPYQVQG